MLFLIIVFGLFALKSSESKTLTAKSNHLPTMAKLSYQQK